MRKLTAFLLDHRRGTIWTILLIALLSACLIPFVNINYDLAEYLPPESGSRQALELLQDTFGYEGFALLMAEDIAINEALVLKQQLEQIDGISSVMWLDDVADLNQPLSQIDATLQESYYQDGCALYTLNFAEDDYSLRTGDALVAARELAAEYNPALYGTAEESRNTRSQVMAEFVNIMLVIVPACLLILVLISTSWFEPLLYIFVICIAVVINMGTNILFDSVSFIIFSMGAAIQLAVSMDYSLFLTHRFEEERAAGHDLRSAVIEATRKTFPAIASSAMTTVAGFGALAFMQYGIGRDIGLVLAKGVLLSFLSVLLFLPPLLYRCHRLVERSRHRTLLHVSARMGRWLTAPRYLFLILMLLIVVPCYLGQLNTDFLYGDSSGSSSSGQIAAERARIGEHFALNDQVVLMVPDGDVAAEKALADALAESPYIDSIQALVTLVDPTIPRSMLPESVLENFAADGWGRFILNVNTIEESAAMYDCVEFIKEQTANYYAEYYLVGKAVSIADIRDSVQADLRLIMGLSMGAVAVIIFLTFRSLIMPVLLIAVIQSAVYINMAVPYFLGQPLVFIGYLVVSSLQLGATIDYAILLASRYVEARASLQPRQAAAEAVHRAGLSVITSGLILAVAGFAEAELSSMGAISTIGLLIGRGALLSMGLVLLALPALFTLCDTLIRWLSLRSGIPARERRLRAGHRRRAGHAARRGLPPGGPGLESDQG